MANEKLATDEDVAKAADALMASSDKVTCRAIWSAIGGGSMTTIASSLRRWRDAQAAKPAQPVLRAPLPAVVEDTMRGAVAELWLAAQAECQLLIEAEKAKASEDIAKAVADRDGVIAELETLSVELTAATEGNTALKSQLAELADQAGQAKTQTTKAEQAKEAADARTNELATELAAVRGDLSAERAKRDEAQQARRAVEINLASAAANLARASQQVIDLTARLDVAAGQHAATRAAHAAEVERLTAAHKETVHEQKQRSLEALDRALKANQRLESEAREHVAAAREAAEKIGRLQGELAALKLGGAGAPGAQGRN